MCCQSPSHCASARCEQSRAINSIDRVVARRSGFSIGKPMRGFRRLAFSKILLRASLNLPIGDARAFVLTKVLHPGLVHEGFHEARGILRVVEKLPEISAVTATHLAYRLHRGDELGTLIGLDAVIDRDQ